MAVSDSVILKTASGASLTLSIAKIDRIISTLMQMRAVLVAASDTGEQGNERHTKH